MRRFSLPVALVLGVLARGAEPPADAETPLPTLPYTPGLEPRFMDRTVDPCVDFYAFSCAGLGEAQRHPAGPVELERLREAGGRRSSVTCGRSSRPRPSPRRRAARSRCRSATTSPPAWTRRASRRSGRRRSQPALTALAAVKDRRGLARWLAEQHMASSTSELLFALRLGAGRHGRDAVHRRGVRRWARAAGPRRLPRPGREVEGAPGEVPRARGANAPRLLGDDAATATRTAALVMDIETTLARATLTRVERRDPYKIFHRIKVAELREARPGIRLEDLPHGDGRSRHPGAQREPAEVPPVDERRS